MAHPQERLFGESVSKRFPQHFSGVLALDIAALDANGNNRFLFDAQSICLGVGLASGSNVDLVCPAHELRLPDATLTLVFSPDRRDPARTWARPFPTPLPSWPPRAVLSAT